MNQPRKRIAILAIALGIAVLLLGTLVIDGPRRHLWNANRLLGESGEVATSAEQRSDGPEAKRPNRRVLDEVQIAARVKSMLDLHEGEVSMIGITAEEVEQALGSIMPNWIKDASGSNIRIAEVSKAAIASELEAMLKRGCKLQSKFGDPAQIEFSGENLRLSLMRSPDVHPERAELILNVKTRDYEVTQSIPMNKGNILLLSPSDPKSGAILVVVGPDSSTSTGTKKNNGRAARAPLSSAVPSLDAARGRLIPSQNLLLSMSSFFLVDCKSAFSILPRICRDPVRVREST